MEDCRGTPPHNVLFNEGETQKKNQGCDRVCTLTPTTRLHNFGCFMLLSAKHAACCSKWVHVVAVKSRVSTRGLRPFILVTVTSDY